MTELIGRDGELGRIEALLAGTAQQRILRAMRIVGSSGVGKSALLAAAQGHATRTGWLVLSVGSHRIHSTLPLFAARRLARAATDALGQSAGRYSSGLNLEAETAEGFEDAFFRLLEGVSLDYPMMIAIDDAQWCDDESLGLISRAVRALADRPIILVSAERMNERRQAAFDIRDESLALDELPSSDASTLVRAEFPDATADVVEAIVARAGGHPVDLIALAKAARDANAVSSRDVDTGMRATIARQLILLDADVRELLQICSLIGEPISLALLSHIWPQSEIADLLSRTPAGLLVQDAGNVRFAHSTISQSVRETIPIEVPFRRRILSAIQNRTNPSVEDLEHIVEQAEACGDRELQRDTLMRIGDNAARLAQYGLAANAWSRAADIMPPSSEETISFYTRLSQMYNGTNREVDSIRVCRKALAATRNDDIREGIGGIAASLILAYWHCGHYESAQSDLETHLAGLSSAPDRAQVLSAGAYIAMQTANADRVRAFILESEGLGEARHPITIVRNHTTEAFLLSRIGEEAGAKTALAMAREAAKPLPPIVSTMPMAAEIVHEFLWRGPKAVEAIFERRIGEETIDLRDMYRAATFLARGEFDEVHSQTAEALVRRTSVLLRRNMVTLRASAAALKNVPSNDRVWEQARSEVAAFVAEDHSSALVPIVEAWLVPLSVSAPDEARGLLKEVMQRRQHPLDVMVLPFPIFLAIAAMNLGEQPVLEQLADAAGIYHDRQPWNFAHHLLARGAAQTFLKRGESRALLRESSELFHKLGAPHFADLAARIRGDEPNTTVEKRSNPAMMGTTRREREIAALVADGLSNREIASKLVLSERTVEGHIANLFAKVNANSRTQIAAWYLRATSSVA